MRDLISNLSYEQNPGTNLTIAECRALTKHKEDIALIINKTDKGSTIVIQNHKDYALAGFTHLNDDRVYKKLDVDLTEGFPRQTIQTRFDQQGYERILQSP